MNRQQIQQLSKQRSFPSVSLFLPTHSADEKRRQTPQRLTHLAYKLKQQLTELNAQAVLEQLNLAIAEVSDEQHDAGIVIYANDRSHVLLHVNFDIPEYATIDQKYITRFLWQGLAKTPNYLVLMLDMHHTRLFNGNGEDLTEITTNGFPFSLPYDVFSDRAKQAVWDGDEDARYRDAFKTHIILKLEKLLHNIPSEPIILIGTEKNRHIFIEHAAHAKQVVAQINGDWAKQTIRQAMPHITQAIHEWLSTQSAADKKFLAEAVGNKHCAFGIKESWYKAAQGLVYALYLDAQFTAWGTIDPQDATRIVLYPEQTAQTIDLVDHLIDQVIATGGTVTIMQQQEKFENPVISLLRD